jgi:alcohol dehydrogenase (cytochrome c)
VNWADGFDDNGRPRRVPGQVPTEQGTLIYPGNQGGTNWYNPSFSPRTGLFYIPTWVNYSSIYVKRPGEYAEGRGFNGGTVRNTVPQGLRVGPVGYRTEDEGYGAVRAIDPHTGDLKWEYKMTEFTQAGILTTASDLVFTGGNEGYFFALNARTGALLWKSTVGGQVASGPMTYAVGGRQYVAVAAGSSLFAFALRQ